MNISWLGHSCFRLSEKIDGQEVVVVTDPYGKEIGLFPPKIKADIVTISNDSLGYNNTDKVSGNLTENFMILDRPGEYEIKKVHISSLTTLLSGKNKNNAPNIIFKFDFNGVTVAHLGRLNEALSDEQIEDLGDVDILLVPIGGVEILDGTKAAEVVRQIEPRLVIPMQYKIKDINLDLADTKKFLAEMGGKAETVDKLKVSRKDLPEENTQVFVLEKV